MAVLFLILCEKTPKHLNVASFNVDKQQLHSKPPPERVNSSSYAKVHPPFDESSFSTLVSVISFFRL